MYKRQAQGLVQVVHLFLHLIDAGFQFGKEIVLELLHCTFPCRPDLFFVSGQLAFLQSTPFFLVFGVIHHLDLESTGFEPDVYKRQPL